LLSNAISAAEDSQDLGAEYDR